MKTPDAYLEWLKRLKIRFETLCNELRDKKLAPNLRNNASAYREENHELTFRACCLIANNKTALREIFSSSAVLEAKLSDFYRGALDRDILPSCKSLLKDFTLADLRDAIPAHCWERNALRSLAYLARDVAIVFGLAAGAVAADSWCAPTARQRARSVER
jgi:hypothetical protein